MRVFALLLGLVLLLPGGCSIGYMVLIIPKELKSTYSDPYFPVVVLIWAFCFVVSIGGIGLIRTALRDKRDEGPRTGDRPAKPE